MALVLRLRVNTTAIWIKDGETLTLIKRLPSTTNQADTVISKVKYEIVPPWPSRSRRDQRRRPLLATDRCRSRRGPREQLGRWRGLEIFQLHRGTHREQRLASMLAGSAGEVYLDDIRLVHGTVARPDRISSATGLRNQPGQRVVVLEAAIRVPAHLSAFTRRPAPLAAAHAAHSGSSSAALYQDIAHAIFFEQLHGELLV